MADASAEHLDKLLDLLAQAKAAEIHQALDFPSWTTYLAGRLKPITKALDRREVQCLVVELRESGMSVRDISAATGVPRSTVGDQVSGLGHLGTVTHGHDGKDYPRDTDSDAEKESTESETRKQRLKPITHDFQRGIVDLGKRVARLFLLTHDDRFTDSKGAIANSNLSDLIRARNELNVVIKQLRQEASGENEDASIQPVTDSIWKRIKLNDGISCSSPWRDSSEEYQRGEAGYSHQGKTDG